MNENKKRIIEEAIENIDDKYINETAETMKKHSGRQIQFTEVMVEKPTPDKNSGLKRAIKITLSSAAALAAVVGTGYVLRNVDLREEPPINPSVSDTSVSTDITTYTPIDTLTPTDITTISAKNPDSSEFILPEGEYVHKSSDFSYARADMYYYKETETAVIQFFSFIEDRIVYQLELNLVGSSVGEVTPEIKACDFFDADVLVLFVPQKSENGGIDYRLQFLKFYENTVSTITTEDKTDILADNYYYFTYDYDMNAFRIKYGGKTTSYLIDATNDIVKKTELFPLDSDNTPSEPKGLSYNRGTQVFEDVFYGLWECTYGGTAETDITEELDIKFSYYGDVSFESWSNYDSAVAEDENGWYISGISGGECVLHYISKDDPETMYSLPCAIEPSWPKSEYFKVYKKVFGGNNFIIEEGSLTSRGVTKFEEQTGFNISDMGDVVTDDNGKQWQSWYNLGAYGTGRVILDPFDPYEDKMSYSLLYCDANFDTVNYQENEEPPVSYLTFKAEKINGKWEVTSILPNPDIPVTEDVDIINPDELEFSFNTDIFERIFYGRWVNENHYQKEFKFTYTGDSSTEYFSRYTDFIAEDERGWYMNGIAGGLGTLMFVPKDNTNIMYYYSDLGGSVSIDDYNGIFYKETYYEETEIHNGCSLSARGIDRINELTGYHIGTTPDQVVDKNGKKWQKWSDRERMSSGKTYLKTYSEDMIEYSLLYGDGEFDLPSFDISEGYPEICYLSFKAEKNDGQWQITEISEFDEKLEFIDFNGSNSDYEDRVLSLTSIINQDIEEMGGGDLSSPVIETEYFHTNDGHYYVLRRLGNNMALQPEFCEFYYYNGYDYALIHNQMGYLKATVLDDVLYTFTQDNIGVHIIAFKDGKGIKNTRVVNMDNLYTMYDISAEKIGDYHLVTVTDYTDSRGTPQVYEYIFTNTPLSNFTINDEGTELTIDEDKKGFSAVIDGEKIYYRADSMKLEDCLWHLTTQAEQIWYSSMIFNVSRNYDDTIWGCDDYELGYLCDYYEFYEYLSSIFTYGFYNEITDNSNVQYTSHLSKIYCNSFSRNENSEVGKITYVIQNNKGAKAEILCTAYRRDENGITTDEVYETYIIPVERDENGWRLGKFYSPR